MTFRTSRIQSVPYTSDYAWALAALVYTTTVPLTFRELQIAAMQAQHDAKQLDVTWEFKSTRNGSPEQTVVSLVKFNDRYSLKTVIDGKPLLRHGFDGKVFYEIDLSGKHFKTEAHFVPQKPYSAEASYPKLKKAEAEFNIDQDSGLFIYGDAIHLKHLTRSIEQGRECWKAVAQLNQPGGKNILITEWFLAENWIPFKFNFGADTSSTRGVASKIRLRVRQNDPRLILNRASLRGFKQVP